MNMKVEFEFVDIAASTKQHEHYIVSTDDNENKINLNCDDTNDFAFSTDTCSDDYVNHSKISVEQGVNETETYHNQQEVRKIVNYNLPYIKREVLDIKDYEENKRKNGEVIAQNKGSKRKKSTKNEIHKCTVCDYKTSKTWQLTRHFRTHTGEKPYSCNFCDYRAAHKSHLNTHLKIHTGEKHLECVLCKYKCFRNLDFHRHVMVHTGEKPYKCNLCEYKASRKIAVREHTERMHLNKTFKTEKT